MKNKIYYTKPSITTKEQEYVNDAVLNGWGDNCYDYIYKFQRSFKKYIGTEEAIATSSCTGALHLILASLGIKEGDEVIVPESTWIASVSPVVYLNAKPVFVDVCKESWCINPEKIEKAITKNTKAIIVVHLYGNIAHMQKINEIAKKHNIFVIEDVAEAIGSEYKNKKLGSIGDAAIFSFHGTKTMTTGEGGMITTNRKDLVQKINILANHGRKPENHSAFWMSEIGYKYKMSNIQAALGLAQLERIDELVDKKREIFNTYYNLFKKHKNIKMNIEPSNTKNSYWMPTIIIENFNEKKKNNLIKDLHEIDIQVRTFFYPVSSFEMFESSCDNEISNYLCSKGINLPSYFDMTNNDIKYIYHKILELLEK